MCKLCSEQLVAARDDLVSLTKDCFLENMDRDVVVLCLDLGQMLWVDGCWARLMVRRNCCQSSLDEGANTDKRQRCAEDNNEYHGASIVQ